MRRGGRDAGVVVVDREALLWDHELDRGVACLGQIDRADHRDADLHLAASQGIQFGAERVQEPRAVAGVLSHNGTLVDVIDRLIAHLHPQTTLRFPGRWDDILAEHAELLDAITEHRVDDAAAIATAHVAKAREIRLQLYAGTLGDRLIDRGA